MECFWEKNEKLFCINSGFFLVFFIKMAELSGVTCAWCKEQFGIDFNEHWLIVCKRCKYVMPDHDCSFICARCARTGVIAQPYHDFECDICCPENRGTALTNAVYIPLK